VEYDPNSSTPLIVPVSCPVENLPEGAHKLSGKLKIKVNPGSLAFRLYQEGEIEEEHTCNNELNREFQEAFEKGGLQIVGIGEQGEARIVELPDHRFFLATLFLPQLTSKEGSPHPLMSAYLEAVLDFKKAAQII